MYSLFLSKLLSTDFKKYLVSSIFASETSIVATVKKEYLEQLFFLFKYSNFFFFKTLADIFSIDLLGRSSVYRFFIYYVFYNRNNTLTFTFRVYLNSEDLINSAVLFYNSSSWLEREIFDMHGIFFFKNNDMRRILSDYGFEGFPLRKDFPLTGFYEVQYSEEDKVVVSQTTKITQALRLFHFSSVWDLTRKKIV
jgi:NADH-quinone oxidoreductase subunit C